MKKTLTVYGLILFLLSLCAICLPVRHCFNQQLTQGNITREIQLPKGPLNIKGTVIVQRKKTINLLQKSIFC